MKNACIVYRNERSVFSRSDVISVEEAFRSGGYAFEEVRVLTDAGEKRLSAALNDLKTQAENVVLLSDKAQLTDLKTVALAVYGEEKFNAESGVAILAEKNKTLFLLEAKKESDNGKVTSVCLSFLQKKYGVRTGKLVLRTIGASDARVESLIARAKSFDGGKMQYLHTRKYDEDVLEILYDETAPKMLTDDVLRLFAEELGDTVYALDDTPLEKQLVYLLKLRGKKISVAESFTGGGIARRIVSVAGASEVYFEGLNTYDEAAKVKRLGVSDYTLKTFGAVSDQTAYEMAAGLINGGDCDVSIATTGLAGPNTDRSLLPIGLCYIAVGVKERVFVYRYKFDGDREEITEKAINYALYLAYKQIKNM